MKSIEEVKRAFEICSEMDSDDCCQCPYADESLGYCGSQKKLFQDAAHYLKQYQAILEAGEQRSER